ncbi:hypothetical protein CONPUDRAFT_75140 [Coniophora puteana RWD-64-598 SS2]|uniref:Uncharacterized protein n=1 Tax=Coniophora puteana (strain RWD-64-598) TaxID=741705 RepID=A0A5M3MHQ1_CONPW|nr:uncharacterized protein CONPUDRAFT_75140 [Coniophora puteana RWD-64-598 SS2]EIW78470.1 hypothetical protein CONPUDRAFT_75140 [Coniophora puteana RWD-64-598 SS2]
MSESSILTQTAAIEELVVSGYLDGYYTMMIPPVINFHREGLRRSKIYTSVYLCLRYLGLIYASWAIRISQTLSSVETTPDMTPRSSASGCYILSIFSIIKMTLQLNLLHRMIRSCYISVILQQIMLRIMLGFALDGMMTLRIHALYGRSYRVIVPLGICYAFEQVANVAAAERRKSGHYGNSTKISRGPGTRRCVYPRAIRFLRLPICYGHLRFPGISLPPACDVLLFLLPTYPGARKVIARDMENMRSIHVCRSTTSSIFCPRDFILKYLHTISATLTSAIGLVSFYFAPAAVAYKSPMGGTTLNVLQRVSDVVQLCMIGPHMMLSIHEHNDKLERGGSQNGTEMLTSIQFASQQPRTSPAARTVLTSIF